MNDQSHMMAFTRDAALERPDAAARRRSGLDASDRAFRLAAKACALLVLAVLVGVVGAAAPARRGTPWRAMLPALLPVLVVDFCYGWLLWVYLTWLPTLFKSQFGLALGGFALYTSLVLLAGVAGDLAGGRLSDELLRRRGPVLARRLPLVAGLAASLVCLLPSLFSRSLLVTTLSLAAAFFFLELTNSTIWALPMDIAPGHAGAASGLVNTGFGIAGVLSPAIFGLLLDSTGGRWQVPLLLSAVLPGVGAVCALRVDPLRSVD
jgi:MFS family permease